MRTRVHLAQLSGRIINYRRLLKYGIFGAGAVLLSVRLPRAVAHKTREDPASPKSARPQTSRSPTRTASPSRSPRSAERYIVAKGYEARYEVALEVVKSLSYNRWRTYNVEDSLRFFGVRLHEVGMIKSDPNKLIARGTDWRFLNERSGS